MPIGMETTPTEGRERVLRHAHALFIERGFDGVSMQQIAAAAGLTKAALYHHFRDKEDLFGHVMRQELDRLRLALAAALAEPASFRDHLTWVARQVFASVRSDFGRLLGDLKRHVSAAHREAIGCHAAPPYDVVRPRFARAVAAGEMRDDLDLDLVVSLFFGLVFSQVQQARLDGPAPPDHEIAGAIVDVLLAGVGTARQR